MQYCFHPLSPIFSPHPVLSCVHCIYLLLLYLVLSITGQPMRPWCISPNTESPETILLQHFHLVPVQNRILENRNRHIDGLVLGAPGFSIKYQQRLEEGFS